MIEPHIKKWIGQSHNPQEDIELERYRSFISILNGYEDYLLDRDGIILSSNLEVVSITGYEEWEIIGTHISKFYSIEDQLKGIPQDDLEKASKKTIFVTTGLRIKKRNSSFWAKIKIRTLFNEGELTGFKMTIQDVTHKAVSSHRLKRLKDEYLNLFNNSFVGMFKISLQDYHILMMNEKASIILGHNGQKKFNEFFDQEDFRRLIKEIVSKKKIEDFELKLSQKNQWLLLSCRLFSNGDFVEGVMIDVTDYKSRDIELHRVKNELDQFIYHSSHEMRAPLATMLGIINLISHEKDVSGVLKYCSILKDQISGVDQLLKSIVAISLNNRDDIKADLIDWNQLLISILKEFGSESTVSIFLTQDCPFIGDLTRTRVILRNLLSNSYKHNNLSIGQSKIQVSIRSNASEVEIKITDNGIGISAEHLQEIFRMFYKATTKAKGHGLGLYAVKVMVDKLGGKINVTSNLGNGATFTIILTNRLNLLEINRD